MRSGSPGGELSHKPDGVPVSAIASDRRRFKFVPEPDHETIIG
jgi:hypothetical protein